MTPERLAALADQSSLLVYRQGRPVDLIHLADVGEPGAAWKADLVAAILKHLPPGQVGESLTIEVDADALARHVRGRASRPRTAGPVGA